MTQATDPFLQAWMWLKLYNLHQKHRCSGDAAPPSNDQCIFNGIAHGDNASLLKDEAGQQHVKDVALRAIAFLDAHAVEWPQVKCNPHVIRALR